MEPCQETSPQRQIKQDQFFEESVSDIVSPTKASSLTQTQPIGPSSIRVYTPQVDTMEEKLSEEESINEKLIKI